MCTIVITAGYASSQKSDSMRRWPIGEHNVAGTREMFYFNTSVFPRVRMYVVMYNYESTAFIGNGPNGGGL